MSSILAICFDAMVDVTPSDSAAQFGAKPAAGFMCDVAGTIKFADGRGVVHTRTVLAGLIYPIAVKQVYSTGTTATGISALVAAPYNGAG